MLEGCAACYHTFAHCDGAKSTRKSCKWQVGQWLVTNKCGKLCKNNVHKNAKSIRVIQIPKEDGWRNAVNQERL